MILSIKKWFAAYWMVIVVASILSGYSFKSDCEVVESEAFNNYSDNTESVCSNDNLKAIPWALRTAGFTLVMGFGHFLLKGKTED